MGVDVLGHHRGQCVARGHLSVRDHGLCRLRTKKACNLCLIKAHGSGEICEAFFVGCILWRDELRLGTQGHSFKAACDNEGCWVELGRGQCQCVQGGGVKDLHILGRGQTLFVQSKRSKIQLLLWI